MGSKPRIFLLFVYFQISMSLIIARMVNDLFLGQHSGRALDCFSLDPGFESVQQQ
jgi:hypothetical protein